MKTKTDALAEIFRQIEDSLQARRINLFQAKEIKDSIECHGDIDHGLSFLKQLEKNNLIRKYLEHDLNHFKMHSFIYHPGLPSSEKQKIIIALKDALDIVETDQKRKRSWESEPTPAELKGEKS